MANQKFIDMRSVSLTREQGIALDKRAQAEDRKAGSLIRRAVVKYLEDVGALKQQTAEETDGDEE